MKKKAAFRSVVRHFSQILRHFRPSRNASPSDTPYAAISTAGFTLIELLVVIFLIGLASAAVILTLPGQGAALREDAERMAARIAASRDEAVLESRPMAVWFRPSGYGFEQRRSGQWLPAVGQSFRQVNWTNGTQIAAVDGDTRQKQTRMVFDQTGLPSAPVNLQLRNDEAIAEINVSASGDVSLAK